MVVDKSLFKDDRGRYIVQGLFIEDTYNSNLAVYTFSGRARSLWHPCRTG